MHLALRAAIAALLFTAAPHAAAQELDSVQVARLAALGRTWGTIQLFHPYLAYRPVDWDRALVEAVPRVIAARSAAEYRMAVDGMLASLGDPSTRAFFISEARSASQADTVPLWVEDGVVHARVRTVTAVATRDQGAGGAVMRRFAESLPAARAVVLDLRDAAPRPGENAELLRYRFPGITRDLVSEVLPSPVTLGALRTRVHNGLTPQVGQTSGGYYSAFATTAAEVLPGWAPRRVPLVLLVDSVVPPVADVLAGVQAAGLGIVVQVGMSRQEVGVTTHTMELADGVRVRMRTGEIVNPNGSAGFVPDTALAGPRAEVLRDALRLASSGRPRRATAGVVPALLAPRVDAYAEPAFPDLGARMLALFRFWTAVEYLFPYKELIGRPWEEVLPEYVPRFAGARDAADYQQAVRELVTELNDSHGTVRGARALGERRGLGTPPIALRYVEGKVAVTHLLEPVPGVRAGDEIVAVDGEPVARLIDRVAAITPASTPQALMRSVVPDLLRGAARSMVRLGLRGLDGTAREAEVARSTTGGDPRWDATEPTHRTTPVFGVLPSGYGYVDLARLEAGEVERMFEAIRATPGTIFDMRGYPRGASFSIAPRLALRPGAPAARFRRPMADARALGEPHLEGASFEFVQRLDPPAGPAYPGRVVMLIDENAISQAEHTALWFEATGRVTFVGTPTTGANGDITNVVLPGGLVAGFSGHDVRHADGRQLQRVGIQPDVRVAPTVRGLVEGRDEVLEAAVRFLGEH
jgi:C-terminal processing protease CtpA/Prc